MGRLWEVFSKQKKCAESMRWECVQVRAWRVIGEVSRGWGEQIMHFAARCWLVVRVSWEATGFEQRSNTPWLVVLMQQVSISVHKLKKKRNIPSFPLRQPNWTPLTGGKSHLSHFCVSSFVESHSWIRAECLKTRKCRPSSNRITSWSLPVSLLSDLQEAFCHEKGISWDSLPRSLSFYGSLLG